MSIDGSVPDHLVVVTLKNLLSNAPHKSGSRVYLGSVYYSPLTKAMYLPGFAWTRYPCGCVKITNPADGSEFWLRQRGEADELYAERI